MKHALLIINPHAGNARIKERLVDVVDIFVKEGWRIEVCTTQAPLDATRIAAERGADFDRVICSGGDGTLNELVNGVLQIQDAERRPEIGYIPAGTTNDFAASLEIPTAIGQSALLATSDRVLHCDIGCVGERYFNYFCGFGAFTEVSYATSQELKRVLGHPAYLLEGVRSLTSIKSHHCVITTQEGEQLSGDFLFAAVSNSYRVAGFSGIWGANIQLDDGLFEVTLVRESKHLEDARDFAETLLGIRKESSVILQFKTKGITFESDSDIDWGIDGEFGGKHRRVEITMNPGAVRIVCPRGSEPGNDR